VGIGESERLLVEGIYLNYIQPYSSESRPIIFLTPLSLLLRLKVI
jgi:hypothetical protein